MSPPRGYTKVGDFSNAVDRNPCSCRVLSCIVASIPRITSSNARRAFYLPFQSPRWLTPRPFRKPQPWDIFYSSTRRRVPWINGSIDRISFANQLGCPNRSICSLLPLIFLMATQDYPGKGLSLLQLTFALNEEVNRTAYSSSHVTSIETTI